MTSFSVRLIDLVDTANESYVSLCSVEWDGFEAALFSYSELAVDDGTEVSLQVCGIHWTWLCLGES